MRQANFDWKLSETEPSESFLQMIRELKLSPFVGKLLWQRGYHEEEDINRFLHPKEQELVSVLTISPTSLSQYIPHIQLEQHRAYR